MFGVGNAFHAVLAAAASAAAHGFDADFRADAAFVVFAGLFAFEEADGREGILAHVNQSNYLRMDNNHNRQIVYLFPSGPGIPRHCHGLTLSAWPAGAPAKNGWAWDIARISLV